MTTSLQPLSDHERALFLRGLSEHSNHPGRPFAETIFRCGIHPVGLSCPEFFSFHSDGVNLRWTRPKNRAPMIVPMEPALKAWFPSWWAGHPKFTTRHILRLVRAFGEECGIRGLGPRSLRHTYIWRLAQVFPPDEVARMAGCTVRVAIDYCRMARTETQAKILSGGLPE